MKTFGQSMNFYIKHKINNVGIALVNKGNNYWDEWSLGERGMQVS